MNQREITISSINGLRHIIAQKAMLALNKHWNEAAFGKISLNQEMVIQLVKVIKDCDQKILQICQAQTNPWTLVKGKKRYHTGEDYSLTKMRRSQEEIIDGDLH